MTPYQEIAMAHPCRLAEETSHPRFGRVVEGGSLVLTINFGHE